MPRQATSSAPSLPRSPPTFFRRAAARMLRVITRPSAAVPAAAACAASCCACSFRRRRSWAAALRRSFSLRRCVGSSARFLSWSCNVVEGHKCRTCGDMRIACGNWDVQTAAQSHAGCTGAAGCACKQQRRRTSTTAMLSWPPAAAACSASAASSAASAGSACCSRARCTPCGDGQGRQQGWHYGRVQGWQAGACWRGARWDMQPMAASHALLSPRPPPPHLQVWRVGRIQVKAEHLLAGFVICLVLQHLWRDSGEHGR